MSIAKHNFKDDNRIGKRGEKIFNAFMESRGYKCENVTRKKEYQEQDIDFLLETRNGLKFTAEVKNDTKIAQTGNIFFETLSNMNFSTTGCFQKTKANMMAIVSESEKMIYILDPEFLKRYVNENSKNLKFRTVPGSNSCGYLIPVSSIEGNVKKVSYRNVEISL